MTDQAKIIIGALAVGTAGYLAYKWFYKPKASLTTGEEAIPVEQFTSGFPLQMGSRGPQVKSLQKVLLKKGGAIAEAITSTGGADGVWGKGTEKAVKAAGYPSVITEAKWQKIINDTVTAKTSSSPAFPLQKGSRGEEVKALQKALLKKGGAIAAYITTTGGADGIWGSGTDKAVKAAGYKVPMGETQWQLYTKGNISILPS